MFFLVVGFIYINEINQKFIIFVFLLLFDNIDEN